MVIDSGEGIYALLAHLQRHSVVVGQGDMVERGEMVGRCGNSGNSSEPHLHMQLMDHPRTAFANGVPFEFAEYEDVTGPRRGVPSKARPFVVGRDAG